MLTRVELRPKGAAFSFQCCWMWSLLRPAEQMLGLPRVMAAKAQGPVGCGGWLLEHIHFLSFPRRDRSPVPVEQH